MTGAVTFPSYAEYQCASNTWFSMIPAHWKAVALRGVLNQRNEKNNPIKTTQILSLSIAHGVTLYSDRGRGGNKRKGDLSAYKIAHEGDIVLNSMNVIVGAVGLSRYTGAISPVYYALYSTTAEVSIGYYDKVFSNPVFQRYLMIYGRGILIKKSDSGKFNTIRMKISPNDLKGTLLPLPPRPEQDQIVAYLRAQDAHIARFIKAKRELIKLLAEQKLHIIDHAVTRGLDAAAALKTSGIEWLGDVPEHWDVLRIKNVVTESDERTSSGTEQLLSLSRYHGLVPFDSLSTRPPSAKDFMKYKVCRSGQLVMNRMQAWSGLFAEATSVGLISPDYSVFNVARRTSANFLSLLFKTRRYVSQFAIRSTGIGTGFNRLYTPQFGSIALALPPFEEQAEICRRITDACKPLDEAIQRAEDEIKLIREYRDRLIADVVTGQVDVRGWQPGPDDVVGDIELATLGDEHEDVTEEEDGDGED